jgi:hypothetical protein
MTSRIQQSPLAGAQAISLDYPTCVDLSRTQHDLRDEIHRRKSKFLIATRSHKKRNGDLENSPSQFLKNTKTFAKVTWPIKLDPLPPLMNVVDTGIVASEVMEVQT